MSNDTKQASQSYYHVLAGQYLTPGAAAKRTAAAKARKAKVKRTPAAIGRDIAAVTESLTRLKAELAETPPSVLEITSAAGGAAVVITKNNIDIERGCRQVGGTFHGRDFERLRDWLNHYYPAEASS